MGFMETAYPIIPGKIQAFLPSSGVVSKDVEDDVVTNMLEALLAMSPKPAAASGSGWREREIPGAWR
jgi:hypothetical protein